MRKRSGQVHSRESSATLQLTVSLLYLIFTQFLTIKQLLATILNKKWVFTTLIVVACSFLFLLSKYHIDIFFRFQHD